MKKQDILDALATKFAAVLTVKQSGQTIAGVAWYVANVFDVNGSSAKRKNVSFYVLNEGDPSDEIAYWDGREPKPAPGPPTFQQELIVWLDTKVADDQVLLYTITHVLPAVERAQVNVLLGKKAIEPSDIVKRVFGVYKDPQGDFQYEVVG